jgi:hypothetical protein
MRPGQNGGKKRFKTANKSEFTAGHRASFVADSVLTVRGSPHFALVSITLATSGEFHWEMVEQDRYALPNAYE